MSYFPLELPDGGTSDDDIAQAAYDLVAARVPGWQPSLASLDTALLEAAARLAAELRRLTLDVSDDVVRGLATSVLGYPREDAISATLTARFTLGAAEPAGYTLPSGTAFALSAPDGTLVAFETVSDATSTTTTLDVVAAAVEPGSAANGLSGPGVMVDAVVAVDGVAALTTSAGGTDAETDAAYLDRIARHTQLLAVHPILASDFALMAETEVEGVMRALAVDGYDPVANTTDNVRTVAVFVQGSDGLPVSSTTRTAVDDLLQAHREINFVVIVADPLLTPLTIVATVKKTTSALASQVQADVQAALANHLDPGAWGGGFGEEPAWVSKPIVYLNELIAVAGSVPGVWTVTALTINGAAADYTMQAGRPQALPQLTAPATVNVT